jgi:very-short-patch-repair endonuclease
VGVLYTKFHPKPYSLNRRLFKSSSILSYTEHDLAVMARYTGNGKMAMAAGMFEKMTPTEMKMQATFQSERFKEFPCYPQTISFGYILDFYFPTAGLAVEVDGLIHLTQANKDRRRDSHLKARGITTMRIRNADFEENPEKVIVKILEKIKALIASHP